MSDVYKLWPARAAICDPNTGLATSEFVKALGRIAALLGGDNQTLPVTFIYVPATGTPNGIVYLNGLGELTSTLAPTDGQFLIGDTGGIPVLGSLAGTAAKITVANGPGTITMTIASDYAGQSSINTLGNVTTGEWNADPVDLDLYVTGNLDVSHLNGGTGASAATYWRGDGTWASASGGGIYGTALIDFGAYPGSNEASIAVTGIGGILSTSKVMAFIMGDDTSVDHTASDHKYGAMLMDLTCGTPTDAVGFTIYARSAEKLQGVWSVRYLWAN